MRWYKYGVETISPHTVLQPACNSRRSSAAAAPGDLQRIARFTAAHPAPEATVATMNIRTACALAGVLAVILCTTGASAGPTCTTTTGSPLTADCNAVAAYLQQLPSTQQCVRTSAGTGDCTPLYNSGTCVASICGSMGNSILCSDAGADVSTLSVTCAQGGTGTLESTTTAGSLIPYGNGNLQITISHS